ncbi:unnamed protein product [Closterium sp. NIES-53]
MITIFDHLVSQPLPLPVLVFVKHVCSVTYGDLVMLGRTSPGPGLLPSFMVKLFWKRMDEVAEGVGVGGGAGHKGGGEGAPRVVVEYSYGEEEEIEEDTSRQAQHRVSGLGGNADEQEGSSSSDESIEHDGEGLGLHPVRRRHRTASGSGQAGPLTAGHSTSAIASGDQVVELLQRVAEVEASQKKLVADVFAKHSEQAAVFNKLAGDFWTAWNMISELSKSTLKQCGDAINGVTEERKLLEGARSKLEGVAAAITKASKDAVEKQLKLVEERVVASFVKGIEKAIKEDLFYSTLPPESMKELKDVVSYQEAEASRLEVLTEAMARGFRGSAGLSTRSRQEEGVAGVRSGVEPQVHERSIPPSSSAGGHVGSPVASLPSRARQTVGKSVEDKDVIVLDQSPRQQTSEAAPKPPPDAFALLRDMLQGLGKKGGKGVVVGEKTGAPIGQVASAGKGAVENRGAPTPSDGAAGKGAEKWGDPSHVAVAAGLLSKTKADSAAQLGIAGRPIKPVGKSSSSVLGDVSLSEPGSPPPGPRPRSPSASKKRQAVTKSTKRAAEATESSDVEKASTVVAARHEKSKKPKVIGYAPPPLPDDQGKTRGCKAPFKGPGMMSRKGKPVSE